MLPLPEIRFLVETDLSDDALKIVANAEWDELIQRYGDDEERTVTVLGGHTDLVLMVPVATMTSVTEISRVGGYVETVLLPEDYIVMWGGRVLRRVSSSWTWAEEVGVTYLPVSRENQRNRVHIDLIKLVIQYSGVQEEWFGDYKAKYPNSYHTARERVMRTFAPNRGMIFA